jgi:hypothetical protein
MYPIRYLRIRESTNSTPHCVQNLESIFSFPIPLEFPQEQTLLLIGPKILSQNDPSLSSLLVS